MKPQKTLQYQLFFLEYMLKSSWFLLSILRSQDRVSDVATQICLDPFISFCTRDMICISWRPAMKQEKRSETFLGISQWRSWPVASAVSTARHLHSPRKHEASKCSAIFTFEENLRCIVRIVGLPSIQRESPKRTPIRLQLQVPSRPLTAFAPAHRIELDFVCQDSSTGINILSCVFPLFLLQTMESVS